MNFTGFLCEYNPFHAGHLRHLTLSRKKGLPCVCVMSGAFVQRGEAAVCDPWKRAQAALNLGCDAVILLPAFYTLQPGEYFARGAMTLLARLGASCITFGSPAEDVETLEEIGRLMADESLSQAMKASLHSGNSYPRALEEAIRETHPEYASAAHAVLSSANATLGLEYLRALRDADYAGEVDMIHRPTDSLSATVIRRQLRGENPKLFLSSLDGWDSLPEAMLHTLRQGVVKNDLLGSLFAYKARNSGEFSLPDDGEGIGNRLLKAARENATWEGIITAAKTKRYTRTRLQRAILHALLGIDAATNTALRQALPLYVYPLALNAAGTELIREFKKSAGVPVIDRPAAFRPEDEALQRLWEIEQKAMELYQILDPALRPGALFTHPVVRQ